MSNPALYLRYFVVCVITMFALMVINGLLVAFTDFDLGSASGVISAILPALDAGQTYVRRTGQPLDKGRMWRLSSVFTLINLGIGVVIFAAFAIFAGAGFLASFANIGLPGLVIILIVVFALYVLASRIFLGLGARTALKHLNQPKT